MWGMDGAPMTAKVPPSRAPASEDVVRTPPHPLRCELCRYDVVCPYDFEGNCTTDGQRSRRYQRRMVTSSRGCVSYSSAAGEAVLDELPHMSSTDLLLIAHDEWKRREERKHNHEESGWIAGWINGFMTSKKWAQEKVKELRAQQKGVRE